MKAKIQVCPRPLCAGFLALSLFSAAAGPIHEAAANGDLDKVRELVWADSSVVNSLDIDGKTALHHAAAKGNLEMVKFLVANKATVNVVSRTRVTPIRLARGFGHPEVEAFLVKQVSSGSNPTGARVPNGGQNASRTVADSPEARANVSSQPAGAGLTNDAGTAGVVREELPPVDLSRLHRIVQGGKVGFIDGTGKLVIPATLPEHTGGSLVSGFSEGLLPVLKPSGWEYIDDKGETKLPLGRRYVQVFRFTDGLAAVDEGNRSGYIDRQGKEVIRPRFSLAFDFKEGLASVSPMEGGSMFIDKSGAQVFTQYSPSMEGFSDGLAVVSMASDRSIVKLCGYLNLKGELVVPCKYTRAEPCSDGMLLAADRSEWFGLDTNGVVQFTGNFRLIRPFTEGLAAAKNDEAWGFINKAGKYMIPAKFENCWQFSEGLAAVKLNGKWGFIDRTGNLVIEAKFTLPESWETSKSKIPQFRGGLAQMPEGSRIGYIDRSGQRVWEPTE